MAVLAVLLSQLLIFVFFVSIDACALVTVGKEDANKAPTTEADTNEQATTTTSQDTCVPMVLDQVNHNIKDEVVDMEVTVSEEVKTKTFVSPGLIIIFYSVDEQMISQQFSILTKIIKSH